MDCKGLAAVLGVRTIVTLWISLQTANIWLHLISLTVWIGGIFFFLVVFGPAVRTLPPGMGVRALNRGRRSLETLSWVAIHLLFITGIFNFLFRGIPAGFRLEGVYYWILTLKLLLFLAMCVHHALQAFKHGPKIASLTEQTAEEIESWPEPLLSYWKRWFLLLKINAALGPIVLLLGLALGRS